MGGCDEIGFDWFVYRYEINEKIIRNNIAKFKTKGLIECGWLYKGGSWSLNGKYFDNQ